MPVLKNAKHERFAQAIAQGKTASDAYQYAGFKPNRHNAATLAQKNTIQTRVAELLEIQGGITQKAIAKAVEKLAITKENVLAELAKIGFAPDIRGAIQWKRTLVPGSDEETEEGVTPEPLYRNEVELIDSDKITAEMAAAIAEIHQTPTGGLKIKLHDKRAALVDIGKHLGMFIDRHEHGKPGDFSDMTDEELHKSIAEDIQSLGPVILENAKKRVSHKGNGTEH